MIPGIDFAGTVVASENADFKPGDAVILNGWGVGEVASTAAMPARRASRATG